MRTLGLAAIATMAAASAALAQTPPDLKGTWSGPWKTVVYGTNPHHPGRAAAPGAPRVRDINFTLQIEGQDGVALWGRSWSNPARKEPFAGVIGPDGRITGADGDGTWSLSIGAADRLDGCYTHSGESPTRSIVATCGTMQRSK